MLTAGLFRPLVDRARDVAHSACFLGTKRAERHTALYYCADKPAVAVAAAAARSSQSDARRLGEVLRSDSLPAQPAGAVRVVCLSDTHERHNYVDVPPGDVLVVAGDMLARNRHFSVAYSVRKLERFAAWLHALPHPQKVVVAGNHDAVCEEIGAEAVRRIFSGHGVVSYLEDTGTGKVAAQRTRPASSAGAGAGTDSGGVYAEGAEGAGLGLKVHGTPYNRGGSRNNAFQSRAEARCAAIPAGLDILISHGQAAPTLQAAPRPQRTAPGVWWLPGSAPIVAMPWQCPSSAGGGEH